MKSNKELITLWKSKSKAGTAYFTGRDSTGRPVVGFYAKSKSDKGPAVRIYDKAIIDNSNEVNPPEMVRLWLRTSKAGRKYLTGKIGETWVVGFIAEKEEGKKPYIRIYEQDNRNRAPAAKSEPETGKEPF